MRGLNCAAKPAPPRVVVSRWPEKRAALWGRGLRTDVEEPPRTASLVGIQGGGVKGLIGIIIVELESSFTGNEGHVFRKGKLGPSALYTLTLRRGREGNESLVRRYIDGWQQTE